MSDILPVCMQDFLYSRKSELRKQQVIFLDLVDGKPGRKLLGFPLYAFL